MGGGKGLWGSLGAPFPRSAPLPFEKCENLLEYHTCFVALCFTQTPFWGLQHKFSSPKDIYKLLNLAQRAKKPEFLFKFIGNPPTQDPSHPPTLPKIFLPTKTAEVKDCFYSLWAYSCPFSNLFSLYWPHKSQGWKMLAWLLEGRRWVSCPLGILWTLRLHLGQGQGVGFEAKQIQGAAEQWQKCYNLANRERRQRVILGGSPKDQLMARSH